MVDRDANADLARRARQAFAEQLAQAGPRILESVLEAARVLLARPAERGLGQQRRDNLQALTINGSDWIRRQSADFRSAGAAERRDIDFDPFGSTSMGKLQLTLVDDATV